MNIYEIFCQYLADHTNWNQGYNYTIGDHCSFYINDPKFKVIVELDKDRGTNGYVDPAIQNDYDWIGATPSAIQDFQDGKMPFGVLMNIQWIKITLIYEDQIVDELLGMRLDNGKADIAFPGYDRPKNSWYYKSGYGYDGLAYHVSIFLGEGAPSVDRNKTYPTAVQII